MEYDVHTPNDVATFVDRVLSNRTISEGKIVITVESGKLNKIYAEEAV